ncbi:hypothetical protein U1Q18_008148 [Sarracenia purpurea var. burkii]
MSPWMIGPSSTERCSSALRPSMRFRLASHIGLLQELHGHTEVKVEATTDRIAAFEAELKAFCAKVEKLEAYLLSSWSTAEVINLDLQIARTVALIEVEKLLKL